MACPIYAYRINPKAPAKQQHWLTAAEWVVFQTPHGPVSITWDEVNDCIRMIGDNQLLSAQPLVGNVIDVSVAKLQD